MNFLWEPLENPLGYNISIIDIIDILLVLFLFYKLYRLAKGTAVINIFFGLTAIYLTYNLVSFLKMKFLTQLLGGFVGAGFILLIILFQPEIRRYLSLLGKGNNNNFFLKLFNDDKKNTSIIDPVIKSCEMFSKLKIGAIIVMAQDDDLKEIISKSVKIDAKISLPLLQSIFFKNSPLHDGAVIIQNNKIIAARCILPITQNEDFPAELGMRHRAAVGISEQSNGITIIVSEQNGNISYAEEGFLKTNISINELEKELKKKYNSEIQI